jgi:MFS family permease
MILKMNKNLGLLLSGQFVSQVGDKFYLLALSFWVLKTTQSPTMMGLVLACSLFPSLILGFVTGAFVDRYNRKRIIVITDIIRGLVVSFVAAAYYLNFLNISIIITSQIVLSINAAFFDPTIPTIIPKMVPKDQLAQANAKTQFIRGMSTIIGPVLGGLMVAGFGYFFAFAFNGLSYLVSAFFESFIEIAGTDQENEEKTSIKTDIVSGYRYIIGAKGLVIVLFMVAIIHFFVGSIEVILPVLANRLPGEGAMNLGYLQAAFGFGAILMAFVISIYSINDREVKLLFLGVFMIGVSYVALALLFMVVPGVVFPFIFIYFFKGASVILAGTCFKTILQKRIDDKMAGRVFGVVSSIGNGSIPFAMMVYGFLLTYIKFQQLVMVSGIILLPVSIIFYYIYQQAAGPYLQGLGASYPMPASQTDTGGNK